MTRLTCYTISTYLLVNGYSQKFKTKQKDATIVHLERTNNGTCTAYFLKNKLKFFQKHNLQTHI